jgi:iron complex transport system ATP-binding protein
MVVGPGGSGKTTLLKALACEIPWGSGRVMIQEVPARLWPAKKRESCMLTCPWRAGGACTVAAEALRNSSGEIEGWNEDASVEYALDLIGMRHLFGRPRCSLGPRDVARLQLAATLAPFLSQAAQRPVHLWLDDPLDGLDNLHQHRLLQWLRNSAGSRHTTVVTVTDFGLARAYDDHGILLREGCLVASGAPTDALGPAELRRAFGEFRTAL